MQLGFSGGEPLLRDDLETLVAEARRLGYYSNLLTSGVGLTPQRAQSQRAAIEALLRNPAAIRPWQPLTDAEWDAVRPFLGGREGHGAHRSRAPPLQGDAAEHDVGHLVHLHGPLELDGDHVAVDAGHRPFSLRHRGTPVLSVDLAGSSMSA